ncbi:MAG TPA: FecR domain-containing protein, partial [Gammaproteobacteria bacterium]
MAGKKGNQDSNSSPQGSTASRAEQPAKLAATHPVYGEAIGTITKGMGKIVATGADGAARTLSKGDVIYQKDVIESPKGGFAQVTFVDGSKFNLGSESKLLVEKYLFDQINGEGKLEASMVKGVFRFISGKISYYSGEEPHTTIKTPVATIGVRGSSIDIEVGPDGTTTILHNTGVIDVGDALGKGVVTLIDPGTASVVTLQSGVSPIFVADDKFVERMNHEFSPFSDSSSPANDQPPGGNEPGHDPDTGNGSGNEAPGTRNDGTIDNFTAVGEALLPPAPESVPGSPQPPEPAPGASFQTTSQILNALPTGAVTLDNTTPTQGDTLTVSNNLADIDGLGTISYQWQRDGVAINGATGTSYTLTQSDVGSTISVVASYTDGKGTLESVSSAVTAAVANLNDAPTGSVTLDNSAPKEGDLLTVSNTLDDLDGLGTISYQWQRDGVDINGATGSSYTTSAS